MDSIISELSKEREYNMGNTWFNVICYADDEVLIVEDKIRFLRSITAQILHMTINTDKTKCITISK